MSIQTFKDLAVTQLIRPMELSTTGAWLVRCNDGQKYVVKLFDGTSKSLSNEFLCHKIAKSMGLTIPDAAIIFITEDQVSVINNIRKELDYFLISPGRYFGVKFVENSHILNHEIHEKLEHSRIKNMHEVPGMIVFDLFVQYLKRPYHNALLHVLSEEQQIFEYVLIDHDQCFGGRDWDADSIRNFQPSLNLYNIPWKWSFFISVNPFKTYVEKLKNLDKGFFSGIIDEIPIEWKKNPEEYDVLCDVLQTRDADEILSLVKRHKRELIIFGLRKRFPPLHHFLAFIDICKGAISKIRSS